MNKAPFSQIANDETLTWSFFSPAQDFVILCRSLARSLHAFESGCFDSCCSPSSSSRYQRSGPGRPSCDPVSRCYRGFSVRFRFQ